MEQKIRDIFAKKKRTLSFEFFPPKTGQREWEAIYPVAKNFKDIGADFFSVTYGAGGSTRNFTMDVVDHLQRKLHIPVMHHITWLFHSVAELRSIISAMRAKNIFNVLALRGDFPGDKVCREIPGDSVKYTHELCRILKSYGDLFCVGVAGYPEGHGECPDKETDASHLKSKIEGGAEFVITQLFFDNSHYFAYLRRLRDIGVKVRVIPGILPIMNYEKTLEFCGRCKVSVPAKIHDIFKPIAGDKKKTLEAGIKFGIEQCP